MAYTYLAHTNQEWPREVAVNDDQQHFLVRAFRSQGVVMQLNDCGD